jgi:cysteine synthase
LLGLPFVAVMPQTTSREKIAAIEFQGGECALVGDPTQVVATAQRMALERGGHFMDQFTYAERATDWRSNNNIAESIFTQMKHERFATPSWLIAGAGTGGTLATLGRYVRYCQHPTRVCGADAQRSVFFDAFDTGQRHHRIEQGSRIEGIGRPRVEPSFVPEVLDACVQVPDVWSIAAMRALTAVLGRPVGGSTGTNLVVALICAQRMREAGERGSIVTLLCDDGTRYAQTYHSSAWCAEQGLGCDLQAEAVTRWMRDGHATTVAELRQSFKD